jgi:recombination protein RecT
MIMSTTTKSNGTALSKAEAKDFEIELMSSRDRIATILPAGHGVDRFMKTVQVAYAREPKLANCTRQSVILSVMYAAEVGLDIGKPLDLCHLVPFGTECQLIIDYKGYIELAYETGHFKVIETRLVREADEFDFYYDPLLVFKHRPSRGGPSPIVGAYGFAQLVSGAVIVEYMDKAEIDQTRESAFSKNSPAWNNWYGEMAKKTPLRRMLKRQRRTPRLGRAIEIEDTLEEARIKLQEAPGRTRTQALTDAVRERRQATAPHPIDTQVASDVEPDEPDDVPGGDEAGETPPNDPSHVLLSLAGERAADLAEAIVRAQHLGAPEVIKRDFCETGSDALSLGKVQDYIHRLYSDKGHAEFVKIAERAAKKLGKGGGK